MMYHEPVLLQECIAGLNIKPDGNYVDVTFGGGGHSKEILKHLNTGKLVAFDQDADAISNIPEDNRLIFVQHNFRFLKNFLKYYGLLQIDGLLADLGVSSHQFDVADRGFTFREDATLDMRMNRNAKTSASTVINEYSEAQLADVFYYYGEIQNARRLAGVITKARAIEPIATSGQLLQIIKICTPSYHENKYLAQAFQALRIEVNGELDALKSMLLQAEEMLKPGGRIVVLTYHSLEDRLVKNFFKTGNFEGKPDKDFFGKLKTTFKQINKNVIVPDEAEIKRNSRARSAKLRIAEKL